MATATTARDTSRYLPTPEAAKRVGLSIWGIRAAAKDGRLHPLKMPGLQTLVYDVEELDRFVANKRRGIVGSERTPVHVSSSSESEAGTLVTPQDAMAFAGLIFDRGGAVAKDIARDAAAGAAEAAAKHVMGPIADAIKPLVQAFADAQQPPAMPATDVERLMSAVRFEFVGLMARLLEALRPIIEAHVQGRQVTEDDRRQFVAPMRELVDQMTGPEDSPQMQAITGDLHSLIDRISEIVEQGSHRPSGHLPGHTATEQTEASPSSPARGATP